MKTSRLLLLAITMTLFSGEARRLHAQGTAFTYQGRLNDNGNPVNGLYDLRFAVYNASSGVGQIGLPVTNSAVAISNGLFTTTLDFEPMIVGADIFTGPARWLEIGVRAGGSSGAFTPLSPRQELTATPYSFYARGAGHATSANTVPWSGLTGVPPDFADGVDDTASPFAGVGLVVNAGVIGVDFAPNGTANTVSRSDHKHAAADITTGTLANARLAGAYSSEMQLNNPANQFAGFFNGTFTGDGSNLTQLNADYLIYGAVGDHLLSPNIPRLNRNNVFQSLFSPSDPAITVRGNSFAPDKMFSAETPGGASFFYLKNDGTVNWTGAAFGDLNGTASSVPWGGILNMPASFADGVDNDTTYSVVVGGGLQLSGTAFSIAPGGVTPNRLSAQGASAGQILKYDGANWTFAADNNTTYSAGAGLALSGTQFSVNYGGNGLASTVARSDHTHGGVYALALHTHSTTDLTSGTLSDARLSANVPLLNRSAQTFSGSNVFAGVVQLTNDANQIRGGFAGDGTGLTNLSAASLNSGVLAEARLSANVARLDASQTFSGANTLNSPANSFSGSGAGLSALNASSLASGTVADARLSANVSLLDASQTFSGANTFSSPANNFTGSGAGLAELNASSLVSGTIADARLSANVALRGAHQSFTGSNQFTGILEATNITNRISGMFTGNGANLTALNASNLASGTVPDARLSPNVTLLDSAQIITGVKTFNNLANNFLGIGSGLTGLNASNLASGTVPDERLSPNVALRSGGNSFSGQQAFMGGNVGIGTASPGELLEVAGNIRGQGLRLQRDVGGGVGPTLTLTNGAFGSGTAAAVEFNVNGPGNSTSAQILAADEGGGAPSSSSLRFSTKVPGAPGNPLAERLRITPEGRVGVGVVAPGELLEVAGNIRGQGLRLQRDVGGGVGPTLTLTNGAFGSGTAAAVEFNVNGPGNSTSAQILAADEGGGAPSSSSLRFSTKVPGAPGNPLAERLRITPEGRVGVGVVAPGELLEVAGNIRGQGLRLQRDVGGGVGPTLTLTNGAFGSGTAAAVEFNVNGPGNSTSAQILAADEGGGAPSSSSLRFSTKVPGAPGNPLAERLRITPEGRVGVGTAAPTERLHVEGNARVTGNVLFGGAPVLSRQTVTVASGDTLTPSSGYVVLDASSGITLNSTTAIANGQAVGQILIIEGEAFSVTIPDNANTRLTGSLTLTLNDILTLIWNGNDWLEISFSSN